MAGTGAKAAMMAAMRREDVAVVLFVRRLGVWTTGQAFRVDPLVCGWCRGITIQGLCMPVSIHWKEHRKLEKELL